MEPDDPDIRDALAKLRATFDQAAGAVLELAKLLATYYNELVLNGIPPEYAIVLTVSYQASFTNGTSPSA